MQYIKHKYQVIIFTSAAGELSSTVFSDYIVELELPDVTESLHDGHDKYDGAAGWLYVHDEFIKQTSLLKEEDDYMVDYWVDKDKWGFQLCPNTLPITTGKLVTFILKAK